MLSRRLVAIAIPALLSPAAAFASRAFSEGERRALRAIEVQTSQEASRLTGLAANYATVAGMHGASDAELAGKLVAMDSALRLGVLSLNAARAALPASARAPTPLPQVLPQARQPQLPRGAAVREPRVAITPVVPSLETLLAQTRFPMRVWGRVADALRALDVETSAGLALSGAHYGRVRTNLEAANVALGRISVFARLRNELLDNPRDSADSIDNFEIQDVLARSNQAETSSSRVQSALNDAASAILGRVY